VQSLGVFIDVILVCTATAVMRIVAGITCDYVGQRRMGRRPEFHLFAHPQLAGRGVDAEIWR